MARILVADDNSNIQKMVSLVFEERGINVVAVGNGEAAVRKVSELHPDIVLADIFMPVRNGYEVCEFVKKDRRFAQTPVILLVGAFDPLDEQEAKRVCADGILKKPFVPPDPLIAMVSALLGKMESAAPPAPAPPAKPETPIATHGRPPEKAQFGKVTSLDEGEEEIPSFGEPVAIPSAENEDDSQSEEPAAEWRRREDAMQYDIPIEAGSVAENLVGGAPGEPIGWRPERVKAAENDFELETDTSHLVPNRDPNLAANSAEWMELMGSSLASRPESSSKPDDSIEETPKPHSPAHTSQEDTPRALNNELEMPGFLATEEIAEENLSAFTLDEAARDSTTNENPESGGPPAGVIPFHLPSEPSRNEEAAPAEASPGQTDFSSLPPPEHAATTAPKAPASVAPSVFAEEVPAVPVKADAATVDATVSKVLKQIEPQIHEILAQGILRPLIEEMLNRELNRK